VVEETRRTRSTPDSARHSTKSRLGLALADHVVVNDNLDRTVDELLAIIGTIAFRLEHLLPHPRGTLANRSGG